jgi:hypothetical protein
MALSRTFVLAIRQLTEINYINVAILLFAAAFFHENVAFGISKRRNASTNSALALHHGFVS